MGLYDGIVRQTFTKALVKTLYLVGLEVFELDVSYNRGNAYYDLGQYERAIEDWDEAIRLNPQAADAYYNRGLAYERLGRQEQADRDFAKAKELGVE